MIRASSTGTTLSTFSLDGAKFPSLEKQLAAWYEQTRKELRSLLKEEGDSDKDEDDVLFSVFLVSANAAENVLLWTSVARKMEQSQQDESKFRKGRPRKGRMQAGGLERRAAKRQLPTPGQGGGIAGRRTRCARGKE